MCTAWPAPQSPSTTGQSPTATLSPQGQIPPPPPRMSGPQASVRLKQSARQEYDAYVQTRLRMMGQPQPVGGARPPAPPRQTVIGVRNSVLWLTAEKGRKSQNLKIFLCTNFDRTM